MGATLDQQRAKQYRVSSRYFLSAADAKLQPQCQMSVLGSTFRLIWSLTNTCCQIATSMPNTWVKVQIDLISHQWQTATSMPNVNAVVQCQIKRWQKYSHNSHNKMLRALNCRVMPQNSNVIHQSQKLHMECLALWGFKCSAGTRESWTKDWQGGWHCKINSGIQKKSFQDNWVTSKKKKNFLDLNQPWETNYSD